MFISEFLACKIPDITIADSLAIKNILKTDGDHVE